MNTNVVPLHESNDRQRPKPKKPLQPKWRLKNVIMAHPDLNSAAKVVGSKVCELFDLEEENAFASNAWIEEMTGYSHSTIRRSLNALEKAGLMRRIVNAGKGGVNQIAPNWKALDPDYRVSDDCRWQPMLTARRGQDWLPGAVNDDCRGQSNLRAVREAEGNQEGNTEREERENAWHVADAPARDCSASNSSDIVPPSAGPACSNISGQPVTPLEPVGSITPSIAPESEPVPSTFVPGHNFTWSEHMPEQPSRPVVPVPVTDMVWKSLRREWTGRTSDDSLEKGYVAKVLKAGWSGAQILRAMDPYNLRLAEMQSDSHQLVSFLRAEFDPDNEQRNAALNEQCDEAAREGGL